MLIITSKPLREARKKASLKKIERTMTELEIELLEAQNELTENDIRIMELEEKNG